jgi:translation elongation factor EF-1alpha
MTITNNTQHENISYSTSHKGGVDCGYLKPGDDVVLSTYDNKPDVKVTLTISKTGDETTIIIEDPGL